MIKFKYYNFYNNYMKFKTTTYQKIGVVYGILILLVIIALGVRFWQGNNLKNATSKSSKSSAAAVVDYTGKLNLESNTTTYKVGEGIDLTITFQAPGKKLDGADIVLLFDPKVVNALGFSEGTYFKLVPRKDIDNTVGKVVITALDAVSAEPVSGKKTLGTIHFQAQKAGTSEIRFDFVKGSTTTSSLVESGTSANILGTAEGVTIRVEP